MNIQLHFTRFAQSAVCALTLAGLASCGNPPPAPKLPGHGTRGPERVILDDSIDASDIREIFTSLNEKGKLNGLAPFVLESDNSELESLGKVLTDFIYQPAHDGDGLISLLRRRVSEKAFSKMRDQSFAADAEGLRSYGSLFQTIASSPWFLDIIERDVGFLSPGLDESLAELSSEYQKALEPPKDCSKGPCPVVTSDSRQVVTDISKFLAVPGLKDLWVGLCDSLSNSWPVVGLMHGLRVVNDRHDGFAFEGIGKGFSRMISTPRDPSRGVPPSQFDSLMDLMLALNGPSDGLFSQVQVNLERKPQLVEVLGTVVQPNVPLRVLPYLPVVPQTIFGLLYANLQNPNQTAYGRDFWLALGDKNSSKHEQAVSDFFVSARAAMANITGVPREPGSPDYLLVNLPLFLNSYVLTKWTVTTLEAHLEKLKKLDPAKFQSALWDLPTSSAPFELFFTEFAERDPGKDNCASAVPGAVAGQPVVVEVFSKSALKEIEEFGLTELSAALSRNCPNGLGNFGYSIPGREDSFKLSLRAAVESLDETRSFADGSALLRSIISYLIRENASGLSPLDNMESDNLLLSAHRMLASMPAETLKSLRAVLFDGIAIEQMSDKAREILLEFYEGRPDLATRFNRILDSMGMLKELDTNTGATRNSPFASYLEVLREVGPREWKTLSDAWVFVGASGIFALDGGPDNSAKARFPSAHSWVGEGSAASLFRLAARIQPQRHRALADFIQQVLEDRNGRKGSEVHWQFAAELVQSNPETMAALVHHFQSGGFGGARQAFSESEREWMVKFVGEGAFRTLWTLATKTLGKQSSGKMIAELRRLSKEGTLKSTISLLSLVRNDRMKAIAGLLQEWESSGELDAFLETLDQIVNRPVSAASQS